MAGQRPDRGYGAGSDGGALVQVQLGDELRTCTWEEFEAQVRAGRIPPDARVRIDALTGQAFVRADELESYRSLRDDAALAWRARFAASPPPVATALLVGVQIRIWWLAQLPGATLAVTAAGTKWSPYVFEDGEVWRLLTMGVVHTHWLHVGVNMVWMAYAGWILERALGWRNLVALFFGSVLGGSLLSVFLATYTPSLGASGGVFGLIGAAIVFGFARTDVLPPEARRWFGVALLPYLVIMFWSGWSNPTTDNWAHLGGMATGLVLGTLVDPDEVERRRGWARAVRWGTAGLGAALLLVLAVVGPRVEPLVTAERARWESLPPGSAKRERPPEVPERPTVRWSVPGGWRTGSGPGTFPGFAGPKDDGKARFFGVRVSERMTIADPAEVGADWAEKLRRDWPDAEVAPARPVDVAGEPGLEIVARFGHPGDERIARWRGAVRGVWLFESVWQVDDDHARRLEPLVARLDGAIDWPAPWELVKARTEAEAMPGSVRARDRLAAALARAGEAEEAVALREALVGERPTDPDAWKAYLEDLATLGPRVAGRPELPATLDRALQAVPSPAIVVRVADVLDAVRRPEEARGLLVVAWDRTPGDRVLERAMARRELPVALDPATLQPWGLVHGPTGAPRPPEERTRREGWPLSLEGASLAADALAADRRRATEEAVRRIEAMDARVVEPLVVLRDGAVADDLAEVRQVLAEELGRAVAGDPPDWVPDEVVGALAEHPEYVAAIAPAPSGPPAPGGG